MMSRFFVFVAATLALLSSSIVIADSAKTPPAQAFIEDIANNVLQVVQDDALDEEAKSKTLQKLFADTVDLEWVAKFVLARHYKAADAKQKKDYIAVYRPFIINNYVSRLTKYTGQTYKMTGTKQTSDGDHLVSMTLDDPSGPQVLVDYRVREEKKKTNKFQVVDIIVEGVSLITTQRSEFNAVVKNKGLDYLIAVLRKKAGFAPVETAEKS